jgi:hypothetical protein
MKKHPQTSASDSPLKSISAAQSYLGNISRAKLYELIPDLETIKLGGRRFIFKASLDDLIERSREVMAVRAQT